MGPARSIRMYQVVVVGEGVAISWATVFPITMARALDAAVGYCPLGPVVWGNTRQF